jgi:hypothetical protein
MPPAVLEPTIPASERRQTHALDRAATGTGNLKPPGELTKSCSVVLFLRNPAAGRHSVVSCFYCSGFQPFRLLHLHILIMGVKTVTVRGPGITRKSSPAPHRIKMGDA